MGPLGDLQSQVDLALKSLGCKIAVDAWRWRADGRGIDYALSLHACKLSIPQEQELVAVLQQSVLAKSLLLARIEGGFLNLQLSEAFWANAVEVWLAAPNSFVSDCGLPADLWEITIFWRYRILKTFHQAAKIAGMEGWITNEHLHCTPPTSEIIQLKSLLSLGGMLQHKRDLQLKRKQMMEQIEGQLLNMWQQPILFPGDPEGSAWRQAVLRLSLIAAAAIGAPLKQSMEEALRMQYT